MTTADARSPVWTGPALLIAGGLAIGFAPIGMRLSEFGPQATALWRYVFALPLIWAIGRAMGVRITRPSPWALAAGVFFGLDMALWHQALTMTSVANATFLVNLGNALVGLLAWWLLKEKPSRLWPMAAGIALLGAFLMSRGAPDETQAEITGDLLAVGAALMVSVYMVASKVARRQDTAVNVIFWATVAEVVVGGGAVAATGERFLPPSLDWFLMPFLLAVIAHAVGQTLIVSGVGRTPAAIAGLLVLVQPVAAALIAWPLFEETLAPVQIAGGGAILLGVWLAGRK